MEQQKNKGGKTRKRKRGIQVGDHNPFKGNALSSGIENPEKDNGVDELRIENVGNDRYFKDGVEFSWIGRGCLLAVDDQGATDSCWIFAALKCITAKLAEEKKIKVALSKQYPMNCFPQCFDDDELPHAYHTPESELSKEVFLRMGYMSTPETVFIYGKDHGGLPEHRDSLPYKACREPCGDEAVTFLDEAPRVKLKAVGTKEDDELTWENVTLLIREQPVAVAIKVHDSFHSFKGKKGEGIYWRTKKEAISEAKEMNKWKKERCYIGGYHAIMLIGFGHDLKSGENFYLVQNSHGVDWGYLGYGKISESVPLYDLAYPVGPELIGKDKSICRIHSSPPEPPVAEVPVVVSEAEVSEAPV